MSVDERNARLDFENRFETDITFQEECVKATRQAFMASDRDQDGVLSHSEFILFHREWEATAKRIGIPVDEESDTSIGLIYEAYNAYNCGYEGVTANDIIECSQLIGSKAKALRAQDYY